MQVIDATARAAIDGARTEVRRAVGWTFGLVALLLLALTVRAAVPGPWGWIAVGLVAGEAWSAGSRALSAWRSAREVARCATCRAAAIQAGRALDDWSVCARSCHTPIPTAGGAA